jgi:FkbM family methyltransferase
LSNTVYLEEQFNWTGLLVEANPAYQDSLAQRKSKSVIAAVTEQEGYFEFCSAGLYGGLSDHLDKSHQKMTESGSTISVWGTTLERILDEHDAPSEINFVSIDVEGAEVPIVEQMCKLPNHRFVCGCIEYNDRRDDLETMTRLLRENGYRVVWSGQTMQDLFFVDESRLVAGG